MNPELLKTELARAEEAELQSEEQLRQLNGLIEKACDPSSMVSATDCAKLVGAALALNERLQGRAEKLRRVSRIPERSAPGNS